MDNILALHGIQKTCLASDTKCEANIKKMMDQLQSTLKSSNDYQLMMTGLEKKFKDQVEVNRTLKADL